MKKKRIFAFLLSFIMLTGLCGCSASAKALISVREKRAAEALLKGEAFWAQQTEHQIGETVTVTDYIDPLSYALQYPKQDTPLWMPALKPLQQRSEMPLSRNIALPLLPKEKKAETRPPLLPFIWDTKPI